VNRLGEQLAQQFSALWGALGLNQRVSLVLSAGAVIAGMVALIVWSSRPDYRLLYGGLDHASASKVVAELSAAGIPHRLGSDGASILVPADQVHSARMQLATKGLPGDSHVGWEIFDKPNFGISDFIQRANYLRAVQGELARTIGQMDEVESARVMIVKPENRLLARESKPATASVFLKVRTTLDETAINAIRNLVANAVEGLAPNFVSITDNRGKVLSENTPDESLLGLTSGQLKVRRNLESYLARKAEDMLETVLGPGRSVVRVSADIDFETVTQTAEIYDPEGKVIRSSTVNDERNDSTTSDVDVSGVPGVSANAATTTNSPSAGSGSVRQDARKIMQEEYDVSRTVSNTVKNAGGIKSISAAVFIAARTVTTNGVTEVVPRSAEELAKLKRVVEGALGIPEDASGEGPNRVVVEEMPFSGAGQAELDADPLAHPHVQLALSILREIGYPALGLVLLALFWRKLRHTADIEIPVGATVGEIEEAARASGRAEEGTDDDELTPGVLSVEAVNRIVQENPDNLTEAIRNWLNEDAARN